MRRLANKFFFEKLLRTHVDGQVRVGRAILKEPWATILETTRRKPLYTENPNLIFQAAARK